MKQHKNASFITSFEKTAAPKWFYEVHQTMNPRSLKQTSKQGIRKMLARRGVK